jgi:hypothetical protein
MEMKVIALIVVFSAYVLASPMNLPPGHPPVIFRGMHEWQTPSESDKRSPCPALNTLANHGYLNRNGQQITAKQMQDAMSRVYNLSPAVGWLLANAAVKGLSPKNGMISLDQLQKHGFIEHDASLVHDDTALGSNWIINNDFLNQFSSLRQVVCVQYSIYDKLHIIIQH